MGPFAGLLNTALHIAGPMGAVIALLCALGALIATLAQLVKVWSAHRLGVLALQNEQRKIDLMGEIVLRASEQHEDLSASAKTIKQQLIKSMFAPPKQLDTEVRQPKRSGSKAGSV